MDADDKTLLLDAIRVALKLVEDVLLPWLVDMVQRGIDGPTALGTATEVVSGIDRNWPDKPESERRQMARDAIRQMLLNRGQTPSSSDLNLMLELALRQIRLATGPASASPPA